MTIKSLCRNGLTAFIMVILLSVLCCTSSRKISYQRDSDLTADDSNSLREKFNRLSGILCLGVGEINRLHRIIRGERPDTFYIIDCKPHALSPIYPNIVIFTSSLNLHSIHPNRDFDFGGADTLHDSLLSMVLFSKLHIIFGQIGFEIQEPFEVRMCRDGYYARCEVKNRKPNGYIMDGVYTCRFNKEMCVVGW